jgi:hypothetical protein
MVYRGLQYIIFTKHTYWIFAVESTVFSPRKVSLLECIYFVTYCISITISYILLPQNIVQMNNTHVITETAHNMVSKKFRISGN